MAYVIDADVFIQAKKLHYGFDFCPAFWEWMVESHRSGAVLSIEKIGDELEAGQDELSVWAKERGSDFFRKPDAALISALGPVSEWVTGAGYEPTAVNTFLQVGDDYLVAYALAHGHTVVTHEVPAATTKKVKIPNACIGLGIKCVNPYEMLRRERARFLLGKTDAVAD
jgi:hypothetical protein